MRRIKANHRCELPSSFVVVDTETYDPNGKPSPGGADEHHVLRLGVACGWRRDGDAFTRETWCDFKTPAQFWAFVAKHCRPRQPCWVFAHRWHYDAQVLGVWELIDRGMLQIDWDDGKQRKRKKDDDDRPERYKGVLAIDESPWWIVGRFGGGSVKLVCSTNYWRTSVAELGRSVKLPQVEKPGPGDGDDAWRARCKRDVEIVAVALQGLMKAWRRENLGNWQPTVTMLAASSWRHCGMRHAVVTHDVGRVKNLERAGYYGGQCTQYFRGLYRGPVHEVDLRSAYPSVMATAQLPWRLVDYLRGEHACELLPCPAGRTAVARVTVTTDRGELPTRRGERVVYPSGTFDTTLAGAELDSALAEGEVDRVHEVATYQTAELFAGWVGYWQAKRTAAELAGDQAGADLAKIVMLSLYGWFGQKPVSWVPCKGFKAPMRWGHFMAPHWKTSEPWRYRAIGGLVEMRNNVPERDGSHIALPACVTAELRERMRRVRRWCPPKSILLQVTDALYVTDAGLEALKASDCWGDGEPGRMRLKQSYAWLDVSAPNSYRSDKGEIACGVPIERLYHTSDSWKIRRPTTTKDVIQNGPTGGVRWRTEILPKWVDESPGVYGGDGWRQVGSD